LAPHFMESKPATYHNTAARHPFFTGTTNKLDHIKKETKHHPLKMHGPVNSKIHHNEDLGNTNRLAWVDLLGIFATAYDHDNTRTPGIG